MSGLKLELVAEDRGEYVGKVAMVRVTMAVQFAAKNLLPAAEKLLEEQRAAAFAQDLLVTPTLKHPVQVLKLLVAGTSVDATLAVNVLEQALDIKPATAEAGKSFVGVVLDVHKNGITQYVDGELLFHSFGRASGDGGSGGVGEVAEIKYERHPFGIGIRWRVEYQDNLPDLENLLGAELDDQEERRGIAR